MIGIHDWFSWVVIFANGLAGIWTLAAHVRPALRGRLLWVSVVAAQLTMVVQIILGSWLIIRHDLEAPNLHALYGFSGLVAIGIAYSYRPQLRQYLYVLYGCTGLFLMGLGIRAVILDSVA